MLDTSTDGLSVFTNVPVLRNDLLGVEPYTLAKLIIISTIIPDRFRSFVSAVDIPEGFPTYSSLELSPLEINLVCSLAHALVTRHTRYNVPFFIRKCHFTVAHSYLAGGCPSPMDSSSKRRRSARGAWLPNGSSRHGCEKEAIIDLTGSKATFHSSWSSCSSGLISF